MPVIKTGRRRRPTQVYWTNPPPPPSAGSPTNPPRQVVVRHVRQPYRPRRVTSTHTVLPTGGVGPGPGATPIFIQVYRPRSSLSARFPRPAIYRPLLGYVPNVTGGGGGGGGGGGAGNGGLIPRVLSVKDLWWAHRFRVFMTRTGPGISFGIAPKPLVSRPVAARRLPPTTVARTQFGRVSIVAPNRANVVALPRRPGPTTARRLSLANPANHPWLPLRPAAIRTPVPPPRPSIYRVAVGSGPQLPRMRIPRPLVVPILRRPARPTRWVQAGSGKGSAGQSIQARPLVARRPPAIRLPYRLIGPALHHPLPSPALHGPMTVPLIVPIPRSPGYGRDQAPGQRFRKYVVYPPQPVPAIGPIGTPPDLVAACIAWLRLQPAIVAAMGEVPATATTPAVEKFFSDIAARSVNPPYLGFFEPDEVEGYETEDYTGLNSTLTDGTLAFELVGSQALGKLGTRQLAEAIVAVLNDAPLTFLDGVLVYLRRSERRYPTFRESGPGTNVVMWKRVCEFDFKIERWAPQF
jgi:hypothetical protein